MGIEVALRRRLVRRCSRLRLVNNVRRFLPRGTISASGTKGAEFHDFLEAPQKLFGPQAVPSYTIQARRSSYLAAAIMNIRLAQRADPLNRIFRAQPSCLNIPFLIAEKAVLAPVGKATGAAKNTSGESKHARVT